MSKIFKIKDSHWFSFVGDFTIDGHEGFIYFINNLLTGQQYIGKKNFYSTSRQKVVGSTRRKVTKKESNWKEYTSSSKYVNEDIAKYGKDNFEFFIIDIYNTKGGLTNAEAYFHHFFEVLTRRFPNGERVFYNRCIAAIKFIPNEIVTDEARKKMSIASKRAWDNPNRREVLSSKMKGKGNPMFGRKHSASTRALIGKIEEKGVYFCGEYGKFNSAVEAAKALNLVPSTIHRRMENLDKVITSNRASKLHRGKTWRELGWKLELKQEK